VKLVIGTTPLDFFLKEYWMLLMYITISHALIHLRKMFPAGTDFFDSEQARNKRLGPCGLALHYANIINQIESIVSSLELMKNLICLFDVTFNMLTW
jgi:hypothetical protein